MRQADTDLYICCSVHPLPFKDIKDDLEDSDTIQEFKLSNQRLAYPDREPINVEDISRWGREYKNPEDPLDNQVQNEEEEAAEDRSNDDRIFKHVDEDYDIINNHHSWPSFEDLLKGLFTD